MVAKANDKVSYQEWKDQWLADAEIEEENLSTLDKGRRFAAKLVTQWLDVTMDDDDFFICDGSGDGGIDIAYLRRADIDVGDRGNDSVEGDIWYLVQSKYGSSFTGHDAIFADGNKVITTLTGENRRLSEDSKRLLQKLDQFRSQASQVDRIVLVFATTDPMSQQDREALERVKLVGRDKVLPNFGVAEISLRTIWDEPPKLTVPLKGKFVEPTSTMLVGTVSLRDLFEFLESYRKRTLDLDQLYDKNLRRYLGSRGKVNRDMLNTLNRTPEKFGLYNNGITIVVSSYTRSANDGTVDMRDPYVVNGCQTTRTIWYALDTKLNAGGTGDDASATDWKEGLSRGSVVTKIVQSEESGIEDITKFTNSQNAVRGRDFTALEPKFQSWAKAMKCQYGIFLEIQRGGIESRKAYEKQHPDQPKVDAYVKAFELIKVYGAGWLAAPGTAFSKNAAFLPDGSIYQRITERPGHPFGETDLYAAYKIKCAADDIGFGRRAGPDHPSRRLSRHLFYHILMRMLENVIRLTPQYRQPPVVASDLTDAVVKLTSLVVKEQFNLLCTSAVALLDQYLTPGGQNTAYDEVAFHDTHNQDLNRFLKSDNLGKEDYSPLLVKQLAMSNAAFASFPMPYHEGSPTPLRFVAQALLAEHDS